ncbi:TetR/AcrR family transcriptional regulator [Streptomyces sp. NBC_01142]|uniref:TetR/AcrR family transcriptional regulator n=1 Tax=Streptomyces sp. NBC_01142 TaxID=2975865 RepID=UPI002250A8CB|nr:TetR/AcrR family transcriptional regulator [Streptomyces sp. NBC_01142]MCX4819262.1 TetR/AcrR family transcriptional regulator [Streptomyces sp. NBC_01142]
MPTARESLLNAALTALGELPWSGVRMADVASAAGVSRQTLYNEFGSKDGLARALVRREADAYLRGVERVLAEQPNVAAERPTGRPAADRLVSVAEWTVGEARAKPLLRALLTGCWGERLPAPRPARRTTAMSGVPAQRRADAGPPAPAELVAAVRDRSLAALDKGHPVIRTKEESADLAHRCELVARLALSCVIAPAVPGEAVGLLVRTAVGATVGARESAGASNTAAERETAGRETAAGRETVGARETAGATERESIGPEGSVSATSPRAAVR